MKSYDIDSYKEFILKYVVDENGAAVLNEDGTINRSKTQEKKTK